MVLDKPESNPAPVQHNSAWMRELFNDSAPGRAPDRAPNLLNVESLGFPKLTTEPFTDQAAPASRNERTAPDERVRDHGTATDTSLPAQTSDDRPTDERVQDHRDNAGPGNSLSDMIRDNRARSTDERVRSRTWNPYEGLTDDAAHYLPKENSPYKGAGIQLNAEPAIYAYQPGDTLQRIAEKHLGPSATPEQINEHVHEISILNSLRVENGTPKKILGGELQTGEHLVLPGHDKHGSNIFSDAQGTRFTYSPDGRETVEYKDGAGYIRTSVPGCGYSDHHFGKDPQDNFDVKIRPDGSVESDTRSDARNTLPLEQERFKLDQLADSKIGLLKERSQFKEDMKAFEKRATEQNLSPEEVAKTYHEISRVLEAKGTQPMDDRKRVRVALGIMAVAAEPYSNDQGGHNTCNVTAIENRTFTREPSAAAKLIADVATTGKYVAADGTTVKLDPQSFSTHGEEARNAPRGYDQRNYASQLFDVAAVNLVCVKHNESTVPPGNLRYSQERPTNAIDTGERLRDYSQNPAPVIAKHPNEAGMFNGMIEINTMITGKHEPEVFLIQKQSQGYGHDNANGYGSKEEFEAKLLELKNAGKFPLVAGVHADNEPFYVGGPGRPVSPQLYQDSHIVLITDYDPKTHTIKYDNQWGNWNDHTQFPVSVDQFYKGTKHVPPTEWLDRLQQRRNVISEDQFAHELETTMASTAKFWDRQRTDGYAGGLNEEARQKAIDMFDQMLQSMSPAKANLVRQHLKTALEPPEPAYVNNVIPLH